MYGQYNGPPQRPGHAARPCRGPFARPDARTATEDRPTAQGPALEWQKGE